MKKLLSLVVVLIILTGCAMFQLTDTQEAVGSILARHVGSGLAAKQPEMAERLTPVAEAFMGSTGSALTLDTFVSVLAGDIDDPLLRADVADLSKLIKLEGPVITVDELWSIRAIMAAFLQGVKMRGVR